MKNVLYVILTVCFLGRCATSLYPEYELIGKHPQTIPNLRLDILNDTTGVITSTEDTSLKQNFFFTKKEKYCLEITFIDEANKFVTLEKGDIIYYTKGKDKIYMINEEHKLIFGKKRKSK